MNNATVFIYAKEGKIKVLSTEDARTHDEMLKRNEWVHTATINACKFIEYLHNDCEDVIAGIAELKLNK